MDKFADVLGRAGAWAGQNKYLSAVKNAFQTYMPLTIAGAVAVLWGNVLVNDNSGLGAFWDGIMALQFLNPAFAAIQNATIGVITIGVTFGIAQEIGVSNGQKGYFTGLLAVSGLIAVTNLENGVDMSALGATGLFTGMFVAFLSSILFCWLRKLDGLKIKMPDTVPPGVARAFEELIPACIVMIIIAFVGLGARFATGATLVRGEIGSGGYAFEGGKYLNEIIASVVQEPLMGVGQSIPGVIIINVLIMLFWLVGIHGNNMLASVKEALWTPLLLENNDAYVANETPKNIVNMGFNQMFGEFGGSGVTIGLVIAIFIFSRREDNRAVATISIVPGLFNINETVTFGIPLVLNPVLGIPFVLAPVLCVLTGYVLTMIGFCPKVVIPSVWTTPPLVFGFVFTGGNIMGAVSQLIVLVLSVVIYAPFLIVYERQQNKEAAQAA